MENGKRFAVCVGIALCVVAAMPSGGRADPPDCQSIPERGETAYWAHGYIDGMVVRVYDVSRYSNVGDEDWNISLRPAGCIGTKFGRSCDDERRRFFETFWGVTSNGFREQARAFLKEAQRESGLTTDGRLESRFDNEPTLRETYKLWQDMLLSPEKLKKVLSVSAGPVSLYSKPSYLVPEGEVTISDLGPTDEANSNANFISGAGLVKCNEIDEVGGLCGQDVLIYGMNTTDHSHSRGKPEIHPIHGIVTEESGPSGNTNERYTEVKIRMFSDYGKTAGKGVNNYMTWKGVILERWAASTPYCEQNQPNPVAGSMVNRPVVFEEPGGANGCKKRMKFFTDYATRECTVRRAEGANPADIERAQLTKGGYALAVVRSGWRRTAPSLVVSPYPSLEQADHGTRNEPAMGVRYYRFQAKLLGIDAQSVRNLRIDRPSHARIVSAAAGEVVFDLPVANFGDRAFNGYSGFVTVSGDIPGPSGNTMVPVSATAYYSLPRPRLSAEVERLTYTIDGPSGAIAACSSPTPSRILYNASYKATTSRLMGTSFRHRWLLDGTSARDEVGPVSRFSFFVWGTRTIAPETTVPSLLLGQRVISEEKLRRGGKRPTFRVQAGDRVDRSPGGQSIEVVETTFWPPMPSVEVGIKRLIEREGPPSAIPCGVTHQIGTVPRRILEVEPELVINTLFAPYVRAGLPPSARAESLPAVACPKFEWSGVETREFGGGERGAGDWTVVPAYPAARTFADLSAASARGEAVPLGYSVSGGKLVVGGDDRPREFRATLKGIDAFGRTANEPVGFQNWKPSGGRLQSDALRSCLDALLGGAMSRIRQDRLESLINLGGVSRNVPGREGPGGQTAPAPGAGGVPGNPDEMLPADGLSRGELGAATGDSGMKKKGRAGGVKKAVRGGSSGAAKASTASGGSTAAVAGVQAQSSPTVERQVRSLAARLSVSGGSLVAPTRWGARLISTGEVGAWMDDIRDLIVFSAR
jgi:hypothetical protein